MGWVLWVAIVLIACLAVAVTNGFLAPLKIHYKARLTPAPVKDSPPIAAPFVGLALSGGGARAAVFAAAGMKALQDRGLLENVTHVSSVSGGGFAASYLALHPMPARGDEDGYFDQMQTVMAHDYFWDTQVQQLRNPLRLFSPSRRLCSLKDALERPDFIGNATFAALPTDRTFFFNAASYDTGQRFIFSNGSLPAPDAQGDYALPAKLRTLSFSNATGDRVTPPDFPISLAVATSAAFPPYLGPMTVQVDAQSGTAEYWHLGDGGVFENPGVETLREAVYARNDNTSATIYSFDAGKKLDGDLSKSTKDISIWSRDVTRLVDVLTEYAATQRTTLYDALDDQSGIKIDLITFDYMDVVRLAKSATPPDPKWLSWDGWQHATPQDIQDSRTPAEHLAKIPTALKITACNQELISTAAEFLVNQRFPK
jgi:predicted acylesterase/phospholipase RssA